MNRTELHNIQGFHPQSLIAAAAHLRANIPRHKTAGDATAIIKNEGHMNGYLDAIDDLIAAASKLPDLTVKLKAQPYSQPPAENLNRP